MCLFVSGGRKVARDENASPNGTCFHLWMEVGMGLGREPPEHEKCVFMFSWSVRGGGSGEGGKGALV